MLIYGRGDDLGDFKQFGDDLISRSLRAKYGPRIQAWQVKRRDAFFDALNKAVRPISELHIFTHSFGAALMLGYHDDELAVARGRMMDFYRGWPTPPQVVMNTEKGLLTVHDLFRAPYTGWRNAMRRKFAPGAFIKIWGCNAGVAGYVYSDAMERNLAPNMPVQHTTSPNYRVGAEFYWRALNGGRLPSIAAAMANYFNISVFAATSGAHIELNTGGRWLSSSRISRPLVARDDIRLHPDRGTYVEFKPSGR
jgi:hypothetical protein